MAGVVTRRYDPADVKAVINLIRRNLLEINSKDYPMEIINRFVTLYDADYMRYLNENGHFYVVCRDDTVAGCGAVMPFQGREDSECVLLSIYVLPELHGRGIGKHVMAALESDDLYTRSKRVEISASITACSFYEQFGYEYMDNKKIPDQDGGYHMEKFL